MMKLFVRLCAPFLLFLSFPFFAVAQDAVEEETSIKEQSIYIPYEELWKVFEKEGRGVFLPYETFEKLWETARESETRPPEWKPPRDTLISEISGEVMVEKDVVRVTSRLSIEILKEGWNEIPLRLTDVAVVKATLDGEPARLLFDQKAGYKLVVEKKGEEPKKVSLDLEFARSFTKTPGRNSVSFQSPVAPVSRWDIKVPESGVKVDIRPLLAASDVPVAEDQELTHVRAFVGAAPTVTFEWTPKAEGAKGLKALASVQAEQQVRIEEGVVRTRANLTYDISRTELSSFALEVPADHKVVNVYDQNVREWSVAEKGDLQLISVQLFEPTKGRQALVVELEKYTEEQEQKIPVIKALDVSRQQGVVVVKMGAGLRAEAAGREGLLQLDARELQGGLARQSWDFTYRYAALPFTLTLRVEKVLPRILVQGLTEIHLTPRELRYESHFIYDVQRAGVFQLTLNVPEGYDVRRVVGRQVAGAPGVVVDRHHLEPAENGMQQMKVSLSQKAFGKVGLALQLHKALNEPDLLTPTGNAAVLALSIPRAKTEAVERESGSVVLYGPESIRVNPTANKGLRTVSYAEAVGSLPTTRRGNERPVLSFAYTDEPVTLAVSAERRAPHVTARQFLEARIESGVIKFDATFFYDIRYSGVKSLRIDVPSEQAGEIRVTNTGIRRTVLPDDPAPENLAEGYVAWSLEGETEFLGAQSIKLSWERKIDELNVGTSIDLAVPRLIPQKVDRAWGQIALAKAEAIDISSTDTREGLRPIDPRQDLMTGAGKIDAAQAYEFHGDWKLAVKATRYETKDVKATSIERGLVRVVLTRGGDRSVQALYAMRSARQRLVIRLPQNATFDTKPLRVNGRPLSIERGDKGDYFVPLVNQDPDTLFLLELRYLEKGGGGALVGPEFPDEPAVQKVYMSVFQPWDRTYLGHTGPWNENMVWVLKGFSTTPRGSRSNDDLVNWVTSGVSVDQTALKNFATDGRHLLYSTLRPEAGAPGGLKVRAASTLLINGLVLAIILVMGVALLGAPWPRRIAWVSCFSIALIVLSVFMPSFVRGLVTTGAMTAGFVVVLVWFLWWGLVTRPRAMARARRNAPKTPPPDPEPEVDAEEEDEDRDEDRDQDGDEDRDQDGDEDRDKDRDEDRDGEEEEGGKKDA